MVRHGVLGQERTRLRRGARAAAVGRSRRADVRARWGAPVRCRIADEVPVVVLCARAVSPHPSCKRTTGRRGPAPWVPGRGWPSGRQGNDLHRAGLQRRVPLHPSRRDGIRPDEPDDPRGDPRTVRTYVGAPDFGLVP
jgi:hypothetical protein